MPAFSSQSIAKQYRQVVFFAGDWGQGCLSCHTCNNLFTVLHVNNVSMNFLTFQIQRKSISI